MALRTRPTQFEWGTGVQTEHITAASRLVSYLTGFAVQPNKAVVGGNAFAHESGIHQDGVIKNPLTYEIMTPQSIGLAGSSITIGKLSGRRGLQSKLAELGYDLEGEALDAVYRQAIALADEKKEVTDDDLVALVEQRMAEVPQAVRLEGWNVTSSHGGKATGMVSLIVGDDERAEAAIGNGPVDATFNCIKQLIPHEATLELYQVHAVTEGTDAQAEVSVRLADPSGRTMTARGADPDTLVASAKAYLGALNKLTARRQAGASGRRRIHSTDTI